MEMEWDRAELARLERVVRDEDRFEPGRTGLIASIFYNIYIADLDIFPRTSITLSRKLMFFEDTDFVLENSFDFKVKETTLLVLQVLVACPALIELHICFFFLQFEPVSGVDLVLQAFSVLHTSRTLHKLAIALRVANCESIGGAKICGERLFDTLLPKVLEDNRFLETVALTFDYCTARMSYLFSRNSARLWKLWMYHSCKDFHDSCDPLEEFINLSKIILLGVGLNFTLKELVLSCGSSELQWSLGACESFHFAMANELNVACNSKLHDMFDFKYLTKGTGEVLCKKKVTRSQQNRIPKSCTILRVIVGTGAYSHQNLTSLSILKLELPKTTRVLDLQTALATILSSNNTLKFVEFCHKLWRITLLEGSNTQVPVVTSHQLVRTSLSRLNLCLSSWAWTEPYTVLNCLILLQRLLASNTGLKRVEVSSTRPTEPLRHDRAAVKNLREFQISIQNALMRIEIELTKKPNLQASMRVGWWQLLRVGTGAVQCEIRYAGPCIRFDLAQKEDYIVIVKLLR